MSTTRQLSLASLTLAAALAAGAQAEVIYSNLGPGGSFNVVSGGIVLGENEVTIGNVDQAVRFTTGGLPVDLTNVRLPLAHHGGPNTVTLAIRSDSGGLPGGVLVSNVLNNMPDFNSIALSSVGFPALVLDPNTTYWLSADAGGTTDLVWHFNDQGLTGDRAGRSGNPVGPWNASAQSTFAFEINGRIVPEPASLSLLSAPLLLTLRRRRPAGA